MKNKSLISVLLVLVIVVVGALLLYPKLSEMYSAGKEGDSVPLAEASDSASDSNRADEFSENIEPSVNKASLAADFTVLDKSGKEVKLSEFFGKPIVVNFWATWCAPCKSELPSFDRLYNEYKEQVVFLMVNLTDGMRDTQSGVERFVKNEGYSFPVYFDKNNSASDAYGVYSIPETLFIDSQGCLVDTYIGAMSEATLKNYLSKINGGLQ